MNPSGLNIQCGLKMVILRPLWLLALLLALCLCIGLKSQTLEENLKTQTSFFTSTNYSSFPNLQPSVVSVLNYKVLKLRESDARMVPGRLKSRRRCWQASPSCQFPPFPPGSSANFNFLQNYVGNAAAVWSANPS